MVDTVVSKFDTERRKPYPDPIFKACEELCISSGSCIFVGDSPLDMKAGKAAGMPVVGVTWGGSNLERLKREKPDEIAVSFNHLKKIIFPACSQAFWGSNIYDAFEIVRNTVC